MLNSEAKIGDTVRLNLKGKRYLCKIGSMGKNANAKLFYQELIRICGKRGGIISDLDDNEAGIMYGDPGSIYWIPSKYLDVVGLI